MKIQQLESFMKISGILLTAGILLSGCAAGLTKAEESIGGTDPGYQVRETGTASSVWSYDYEIAPDTLALTVKTKEGSVIVSKPGETRKFEDLKEEGGKTTWKNTESGISASVEPKGNYLEVKFAFQEGEDTALAWPSVSAPLYYLPMGEGKRIPAEDEAWNTFLNGSEMGMVEQLSMPFWAAVNGDQSVVCILETPLRSRLKFDEEGPVSFKAVHEYPAMEDKRELVIRVYITDSSPVSAAKVYRSYVEETGKLSTWETKLAANPNIEKLFGAPQIYLWNSLAIGEEDVNWKALQKNNSSPILTHIWETADKSQDEEILNVFKEIGGKDYVDRYQKQQILNMISAAVKQPDFYDSSLFPKQDEKMTALLKSGLDQLSQADIITLNKHAISANLSDIFASADNWNEKASAGLIKDMKEAGIERAWIGLDDWKQAAVSENLAQTAAEAGYLVGPYDSYHSIHESGKEQWDTAAFPDKTLYDQATVTNKDGEKEAGFKNVGRKLNAVQALPFVKERVKRIKDQVPEFNSWFIDCDATGEIYDDYTPGHETTRGEDLAARLDCMIWIRDEYDLVIGSEGGNDFAASVIAYAHGIELPTFSWRDEDMKNKDSEYYIGRYYSATGGVPEHFGKKIPVKDMFYPIFLDPQYDLPLYKLVYNDSVITTYHWDWSTLKIKGLETQRMLREILYDVPPLYHLDRASWDQNRETIVNHVKTWSVFGAEAVKKEMTDYTRLTQDGSVQSTGFGPDLQTVVNFGKEEYSYGGQVIPAQSALIIQNGENLIYTPQVIQE